MNLGSRKTNVSSKINAPTTLLEKTFTILTLRYNVFHCSFSFHESNNVNTKLNSDLKI